MYVYTYAHYVLLTENTHIYIQYILYHISTSAEPRTPRQGLGHHPTRSSRAHAIVTQRSTPEYDGPPHGHSRDFWNIRKMGGEVVPNIFQNDNCLVKKMGIKQLPKPWDNLRQSYMGAGWNPGKEVKILKGFWLRWFQLIPKKISEMGLSSQLVCSEQHFQLIDSDTPDNRQNFQDSTASEASTGVSYSLSDCSTNRNQWRDLRSSGLWPKDLQTCDSLIISS
jgi:hypothetical protein